MWPFRQYQQEHHSYDMPPENSQYSYYSKEQDLFDSLLNHSNQLFDLQNYCQDILQENQNTNYEFESSAGQEKITLKKLNNQNEIFQRGKQIKFKQNENDELQGEMINQQEISENKSSMDEILSSTSSQDNTKKQKKKSEKKVQERAKKKGDEKKNMLIVFKRCFIRLYKDQLDDLRVNQTIREFLSKTNKTSRLQFQNIFKIDEVRVLLLQMFLNRKLERQIQFSRLEPSNRKLFMSKVSLLKKAFIQKRLPNL